tara:strand:- start:158 stop:1345 length:1188 start_codon:yes stop_codon:yes gene_type:complete
MEEKLIVEINDDKIKYAVFNVDEKLNYAITSKKISHNAGIKKGKISDFNHTAKIIIEDLQDIEQKTKKVFKNISVVLNQQEIFCTNLSGFKKLNGSKVEKRDLDYILNEAKSSITKNYEKDSILHILNSNFILDKTKQKKMPLNIFGDHLSLHMTFISIPNNNLKNIKAIFNHNNLNIDRIISKPLADGLYLLNEKKDLKNFITISVDNELSTVSLYEDSSLVFFKNFPFGTNAIYEDLIQLCSLKRDEIELIINSFNFDNLQENKDKYIDKKFFIKSDFKKLSIEHIQNIIDARVKEIIDYTFNRNKNLNYLDNKISNVYLCFENETVYKNLENLFKKSINTEHNKIFTESVKKDDFGSLLGAAELIFKGWHKEAIPFSNKKKSIISGFFERFF